MSKQCDKRSDDIIVLVMKLLYGPVCRFSHRKRTQAQDFQQGRIRLTKEVMRKHDVMSVITHICTLLGLNV